MILEVVRSLTDWLNDGTNGIVAQLALIPYDATESAPTVGTIADETRNDQVAQGRLPSTPGVAVSVQAIDFMDPTVVVITKDGIADVLIRVGTSASNTKNATRDASYILRAALRSFRLYEASTRTRNSISVYACEQLVCAPMWQPIEDQVMTGAIKARLRFRDTAP